MRKYLVTVAAAAVLAFAASPGKAAVINDLGVNPTSAQGAFKNSVGGTSFTDQYLFQLANAQNFLTIASVTNVYPKVTDFISNFAASIYNFGADNLFGTGDDQLLFGPEGASPCGSMCQFVAGAAILPAGNYYAQFTGQGGGTSGYGGNIAVSAVPIPAALPLFGTALGGLFLLKKKHRARKGANAFTAA